MSHVAWMLELEVQGGRDAQFRDLMAEMVKATEENEPGTLDYEWSVSADGRQCHIFERYVDSAAAMVHARTFGAKYAERFLGCLKPTRMHLYGTPSAEVREALAGLGPVHMAPALGFSR